jgi:hypothetical protein
LGPRLVSAVAFTATQQWPDFVEVRSRAATLHLVAGKENGKWLFKKLLWNTTFFARYETGWHVQPLVGFLPMLNPDKPPTAFHPYPSGYHFPYSFPHPVTEEAETTVAQYRHPMAT